jgi:hypothetical protein
MESKQAQIVADFPQVLHQKVFFQSLVITPPLPECEVCVIVPVRNEAQTLNATLGALAHQVDLQGTRLDPKRYEIILLLNNCCDRSADIAWTFTTQHPDINLHIVEITLPPSEAYIGRVRQILMDEAYRRLNSLGRKRGIIASTDGDSQVNKTWVAANMYEIACGADAVGGRILIDKAERAALHPYAKACHLREVGYRYLICELESYIDPTKCDNFPRHYQHYGASLAVTTEMYALAGGLPPVRTPEDVAFYQALLRVNARFRHSPKVRVVTSARVSGRTDIGLANQLNEWAKMGRQKQAFLVESAVAIKTRLTTRHQLRMLWLRLLDGHLPQHEEVVNIADSLGVNSQWLLEEIRQPQTFGKLFERVEQRQEFEGVWASRWQKVDIEEAIKELRYTLSTKHSLTNKTEKYMLDYVKR